MKPLTSTDIRGSFVNATPSELTHMGLPGLHEMVWDSREFLGWRDPHAHQRGYLVFWRAERPVGIVLRAASSQPTPGISAMCSLCRTPQPGHQVTLFAAPKAGQSGRDGNTIGTYICSDLRCSTIIRIAPPKYDMQPHPDEVIASRVAGLVQRLESFLGAVLDSAV